MPTPTKPEARSAYLPRGAAWQLMHSQAPEVLLSGPAGTGKTAACLTKLHLVAESVPGSRSLIVRRTRASVTESALVTFEGFVLPPGHPAREGAGRANRQAYHYPNGSVIVVGGLDKPGRIMSTEYDLVYCVTGDTRVESPSPIERSYDRPFSGQLVTITTARGNKLTGTPNHPVLSADGWVGLSELRKGDYVVSRCLSEQTASRANPDIGQQPPTIADVVRALALANPGGAERVETVPMDFHGDATNGYVDVVTSAGLLQDRCHAAALNPITNLDGCRRNLEQGTLVRHGAGGKLGIGIDSARIRRPLFSAKATHSLAVGFGIHPVATISGAGRGEPPFPVAVGVPDMAECLTFGGSSPPNSPGRHFVFQPWHAAAERGGYREKSPLASEVSLDRVVNVSWADAPAGGHVYNLQTSQNWYFANNIVSHNCQEAIELEEAGWEALTTRLRHGALPYQQLLADTNPDRPTHWLKKRCDQGKTVILESRHEDNPLLWASVWTPTGQAYLAKLDALTGPRKLRLRHGRWVQAEGVVYEGWDASIHLVDRFSIPADWPRLLAVDFGFTNPFVAQWWAVDPDGRLFRYRELYHTRRLVEDHARRILELSKSEPVPFAVICDHDAEDRATLERYLGRETAPAIKDKSPGLQAVQARLRRAGDGKPRLFLCRDALDERDPALVEAKRPTCTEEEIDGYIWDTRAGRRVGEEPIKENDHGCDALRYLVFGLDCEGDNGEQNDETSYTRARG